MAEQLHHEIARTVRATALVYPHAEGAGIQPVELPDPGSKSVILETLNSGISRGTESLVFAGNVPHSEWERMRCPHQVGNFSFPISYGYMLVGKVIATGEDVDSVQKGDVVFALHPHASHAVIEEHMVSKIPGTIAPSRAVLAANVETALNACWDGNLEPGMNTCVIGAGVVGLLTAYIAKTMTDTAVTIIDINPTRRKVAGKLGLNFALPNDAPQECDVVFHTSASGDGLQLALDIAAFEGRVVEMSWYGDKDVTLSLGGTFHSRRLQLISSQVGHVSPARRETTSYQARMAEALQHLENPELDHLLEPAIAFMALPGHLPDILGGDSQILCQVIDYT